MRRSYAAFTVGLLFIVVVALGFVVFRKTSEKISETGYVVHAKFSDAIGLSSKSRVLAAGLPIGQIQAMTLDDDARAKITIRIRPNITLYKNALVAKKSASLLGEFYLEIDPGTKLAMVDGTRTEVGTIQDGDEITRVLEPVAIADIQAQVAGTLPLLRDILGDVRNLTSGAITEIAKNTSKLISDNSVVLERLLSRIDGIAADVESITRAERDDVKITLQNLRDITEGIKGLVGQGETEVAETGSELRSSLQKIQDSVDSLDRSLDNVAEATGKVARGEGTIGRLIDDDGIARKIESIADDADGFIGGLSRLQTNIRLRTEYNYGAGVKSFVELRLWPRPDKFYMIEIVDDPRGFREETWETVSSSDAERGSCLKTAWSLLKSCVFRFSSASDGGISPGVSG